MICYKDMTFCIQDLCKKPCRRKLTEEIKQKAAEADMPLCISRYTCLDCGGDNESEPQTVS